MKLSSRSFVCLCGSASRCFSSSIKRCRGEVIDGRCRGEVIDGRLVGREIRDEVRGEVERWVRRGNRRPHLTAVLVGNDPASKIYVQNKVNAAKYTGITSRVLNLPDTITESELLDCVYTLNNDSTVDGLLVQLPLPHRLNERRVCDSVAPWKDVDGFSVVNVGRLCTGMPSMVPATASAVVQIIKRSGISTVCKNAVVCGRSKNVGLPISMLLHSDTKCGENFCNCTTTICHRFTPLQDLKRATLNADILVVATGIPRLITADMVKPGAMVIDVGFTQVIDKSTGKKRLVGDVDFEGVLERAGHITPVPGGVGPVTVAMLMKNTLIAARKEINFTDISTHYAFNKSDTIHSSCDTSMDIKSTYPQQTSR